MLVSWVDLSGNNRLDSSICFFARLVCAHVVERFVAENAVVGVNPIEFGVLRQEALAFINRVCNGWRATVETLVIVNQMIAHGGNVYGVFA